MKVAGSEAKTGKTLVGPVKIIEHFIINKEQTRTSKTKMSFSQSFKLHTIQLRAYQTYKWLSTKCLYLTTFCSMSTSICSTPQTSCSRDVAVRRLISGTGIIHDIPSRIRAAYIYKQNVNIYTSSDFFHSFQVI